MRGLRAAKTRAVRFRLEVEQEALLASVEVPEPDGLPLLERLHLPRGVSCRGLDLDHLSALIRHHQRQHRARQKQGQVDHLDAAQFAHGGYTTPSLRRAATAESS
jgi:hypothetical protein